MFKIVNKESERNVQIISFIIIFISCRIYIKNILIAIKLDYLLITSRRQASKNMTNESNFKKHLPERFLNVNESRILVLQGHFKVPFSSRLYSTN